MPISTPRTLLRFLQTREVGPDTWKHLVDHYGPAIFQWCAKRGLQPSDAEDVTQDVLVKLVRRLHDYVYDPAVGFRPYLRRLIQSALVDCVEDVRKFSPPGSGGPDAALDELPARGELEQALRERFDHELLTEATVRVAAQVEPKTWEAFRLQAFEGLPAAEVAGRLGMTVASAYKAKSNVQKRLREQVRLLEGGDTPPAEGPVPEGGG